ncbi:MAG: helicase C-terminal domain-containing protein [Thermodesulfobacteriota bacterium]|nr:helicase C-terminal domain-containing protein [Thermodesulfobacteriota bacterium]
MAGEVLRCLKDKKDLLIEAGTGVGKSFAYLIPAVLSQEKTVVSTSSLALQDQLVKKDLVFLQKALPQKFSFGILKGRNNYLCLKREKEYAGAGRTYEKSFKWLSKTRTGEKAELSFIPKFWPEVCGDSQDCNGRMCPFYDRCFYYRHYRKLHKKDILVVNHHLLIYDLLSDFNVLPFHKQLIIDEASDIEDVISNVLGSSLSYSRTMWLLYRLKGLKIIVDHLFAEAESFFKKTDVPFQPVFPIPVPVIERLKSLREKLALNKTISTLEKQRKSVADDELKDKIETTIDYVKSFTADIDDFIGQDDADRVYYVVGNGNALEFKSNLVESRSAFRVLTDIYDSTIMTSATLTSGGKFTFLKKRLGIEDFEEKIIGSSFDYRRQSLLYVDKDLPGPDRGNDEIFQQESLGVIEGLIDASRGRALVLFTSYKHLHFVAKNIKISYHFKSQGDMPPAKLIKWFRNAPNSVLLATATFWQGVDIKGDDLSLVIIGKLPFSSPGDPVYQERCRRLKDRWFNDLALPSAILTLRQGFGRLIRGRDEYGVVAILDTRIVSRSYGRTIVSSLPETNVVHSVEDVKTFFDSIPSTKTPAAEQKIDSGNIKGVGIT